MLAEVHNSKAYYPIVRGAPLENVIIYLFHNGWHILKCDLEEVTFSVVPDLYICHINSPFF